MKQVKCRRTLSAGRRHAARSLRLLVLVVAGVAAAAASAAVAGAAPDMRVGRISSPESAAGIGVPLLKPVPMVARSTTGPTPPRGVVFRGAPLKGASVAGAPGEVVIPGVPAYKWRDGCGPTAAAMVVGYWDGAGYDDLVSGSALTQTADVDLMLSTHGAVDAPGHYEDYALPKEVDYTLLPDRSEDPAGDEHVSNCVADFMHTSWSSEGSLYGWSWSSMIGPSFTGYVQWKYPGSIPQSRTYPGTALTWDVVKGEIDAGRPMVFLVDVTADASTDHFVPVFGYRETNGYPEYACWDTWSTTLMRWERFRGMSTQWAWGVWGGFTFTIGGATPDPDPTPTPTPTPTPDPTPPADTTAPVTTVAGADDAWHASSVTLTFAATDDLSGVASTEYALDGGAWVRGASLTLALGKKGVNSGVHVVAYRSTDFAGNVEAEKYATVKLDGKVPATTSNASDYPGSGAFTVTLSPTDAHSGVAVTWYAIDGKSYKSGTSAQITAKGTHTVKFYSVDVAGNTEGAKSVRIVIK